MSNSRERSNVSLAEGFGTWLTVNKDCSIKEAALLGLADGILFTSGVYGTLMTGSFVPAILGSVAVSTRKFLSLGLVIQQKDNL